MVGHDMKDEMPKWRMALFSYIIRFYSKLGFNLVWNTFDVSQKAGDDIYHEYLGPNWRKELEEHDKVIPTIVQNHVVNPDIWLTLSSKWMPSFVAKSDTKKSIVAKQAEALQCLFIDRPKGKDAKLETNGALEAIKERQHAIQDGRYKPLIIFPEGTTTNGNFLIRFKRGAFVSLLPVQPLVNRYYGFPGVPSQGCFSATLAAFYLCWFNLYTV